MEFTDDFAKDVVGTSTEYVRAAVTNVHCHGAEDRFVDAFGKLSPDEPGILGYNLRFIRFAVHCLREDLDPSDAIGFHIARRRPKICP